MAANYTTDGLSFAYVKLIADIPQENEKKGKFYPQKIQAIQPNRVNILIDSEDRTSGSNNDFDFFVKFQSEIFAKQVYLSNAILPLAPTIHDKNKTLKINANGTDITITLDTGYFNPVTFTNMLQGKLQAAWISEIDVTASVIVTYDNAGRFISITDNSPALIGGPFPITFLDCPYTRYGKHVAEFKTGVASVTHKSISLEMISSRYYYIKSQRLTQSQRAGTVCSGIQTYDIVGIVYTCEMYDENQYQSTIFPGTAKSFTVTNAPVINLNISSFKEVDIRIEDEFGFNLYSLMDDGSFSYGVVLQFIGDFF